MVFISQSQKDSTLTINLRKTFARIVYFIEQTNNGKSKETILKDQTTGDELQLIGTKNIGYYPEKVYLDNFGDFHHFILYFPPVPKHWEVFDLMELDADNPFEYKNIQRNSTGIYQKRFN